MSNNPFYRMIQNPTGEEPQAARMPLRQSSPDPYASGMASQSQNFSREGPYGGPSSPPPYEEASQRRTIPIDDKNDRSLYTPPSGPPPSNSHYPAQPDYSSFSSTSSEKGRPPYPPPENYPHESTYNRTPEPGPSRSLLNPSPSPGRVPSPGSSQSRSPSGLGQMLSNTPAEAPPAFSRQPPPQFPYTPFPAISLVGNSDALDKGFPFVSPPSASQPHPFATHDVTQDDWTRFLHDLQKSATLSGGQRIAANVLPMAMSVSLIPGLFVTKAIEKRMKNKKDEPAGQLVDTWNHYFFYPRRMEVVLARGADRVSGSVNPSPAWDQEVERLGLRRSGSSRSLSSSSSSSSSSSDRHHRHSNRKARKEERRAERRERKRERRDSKRKNRSGSNDTWRLFVTPLYQ